MADNEAVLQGIARQPGVTYSALTPNIKGFHNAVSLKHIFVSTTTSYVNFCWADVIALEDKHWGTAGWMLFTVTFLE